MPRGQLTKEKLKYEVLKIKRDLDRERWTSDSKELAHLYLNKVLDKIEEYGI
jgi:hypothetical protein